MASVVVPFEISSLMHRLSTTSTSSFTPRSFVSFEKDLLLLASKSHMTTVLVRSSS
jgi:hypothetical protein